MPDVVEPQNGPPAVDQTGNLTIWAIPGDTAGIDLDKLTVTNLTAATAKRITYSFTPDGWALTLPQEKNDDDRLTAKQRRQSLGRVNPELADLKYVDSDDAGSAAEILSPGSWIFVERRKTDNAVLAAAGQKVRGIKVSLGVQAPGETNGSGKFTKTQTAVVEYVSEEHALLAGS